MNDGLDHVDLYDDPMAAQAEQAYQELLAQAQDLTPAQRFALTSGPLYPTLEEWVTQYFCVTFARYVGKVHWCAKWWDHDEAVIRLDYLWGAFEVCRRKVNGGLAEFLTQHFDPQRQILFGSDGPFIACSEQRHETPAKMPTDPAPEGWFEMTQAQHDSYRKQKGWLK